MACLSGRLQPDLAKEGTPLSQSVAAPEVLRGRPTVFSTHGSADMVTPFSVGEETVRLAEGLGLPHTFLPHQQGHNVEPVTLRACAAHLASC